MKIFYGEWFIPMRLAVQSMNVRACVALVLGTCAVLPRVSFADDAIDTVLEKHGPGRLLFAWK